MRELGFMEFRSSRVSRYERDPIAERSCGVEEQTLRQQTTRQQTDRSDKQITDCQTTDEQKTKQQTEEEELGSFCIT